MMALFEEQGTGVKEKIGNAKNMVVNVYNRQSTAGKIALIFIFIIIIAIAIFFLGIAVEGIVGFFTTAFGIAVILLLLLSIGVYVYLKYSGIIGEQEWYMKILLIGVIMFLIIIFIGVMPILQEAFITAFPYLLIIAVGYGLYVFLKGMTSKENRTIVTIIVILIIVLIPISQIFIVPQVYGTPMRVDAYIMRDENGDVHSKVSGGTWSLYMSATTTLNPFGATVYQTSRTMWYMGDYKKYFYTITITDYYGNILYKKEMAQVYLTKSDYIHDVGLFYLQHERYYAILIELTVYDESGVYIVSHSSAEITNYR